MITCGQVFQGNTAGGESNWSSYQGATYTDLTGPEKIHSLVIPGNTVSTITLSELTVDLDMMIASVCNDPQSVFAGSANSNNTNEVVGLNNLNANPVTVYIIVDAIREP